jgi:hypothetical protein
MKLEAFEVWLIFVISSHHYFGKCLTISFAALVHFLAIADVGLISKGS